MEKKTEELPADDKEKEEQEKRLLEEHPFETDSQIQNRYGNGRNQSGSDGTQQGARGSNH